jgi:lipid-A-disaccharide synthase
VARFFIKSRYISLVNLLAEAEIFPEYLTWWDSSDELVRWGLLWLDDPAARDEARTALATLRYHVARPGASDRSAQRIARLLDRRHQDKPDRSPHFDRPERRLRSDRAGDRQAREL